MLPSLPGSRRDDDPLELAVLGVGNIGSVHLRSALAMPSADVVAAADASERGRRRAKRAGVPHTYDGIETLFESEQPDAAVVAVPPSLHRTAVESAAAHGVDVFVEKPLATSVAEADALLAAAAEGGVAVGVDHTLRYQPDIAAVREEFRSGHIGHVPYATMTRLNDGALGTPPVTTPPPDWQLESSADAGALLELGVHCFDVLEWLFGPLEVAEVVLGDTLRTPGEDAATVVLRTPGGETTVVCHCGTYQWETLPDVNTRLRLEGVAGTATSADHRPNFYVQAARAGLTNLVARLTGGAPSVYGPTYYLRAHSAALADFVRARRAGKRPPVDGRTGRRTVALVEEAVGRADPAPAVADPPEVSG